MNEKIAIAIIAAFVTFVFMLVIQLIFFRKRHDTPCPALTLHKEVSKRPCPDVTAAAGRADHGYNKAKDLEDKMPEIYRDLNKIKVEQGKQSERDEWFKQILDQLNKNFQTLNKSVNEIKESLNRG